MPERLVAAAPSLPAARAGAVLQVLLATSLFGTIGTARALGPQAPAAAVGAVRALLAAVVLAAVAVLVRERLAGVLRQPPVWAAGVAQAAFQVTFLAAVPRVGVALGTLLAIGSAPVFAGLLHRRVDRGWVAATSLSVAGLVLLVTDGASAPVSPGVPGVVLALAAGLSYAGYLLATGRAVTAAAGAGPTAVTTGTFAVAALVLSPALLLTDLTWLGTGPGLATVLWLALVPTVVSYLLLARGLRGVSAPVASTLGLAEPLVAALLGTVLLGERLGSLGWTGAALVLTGLLAAGGGAAKRRRTVAEPGGLPTGRGSRA